MKVVYSRIPPNRSDVLLDSLMHFSPEIISFLEHYQSDVALRWSADDLKAQLQFVNSQIGGEEWLDWSTQIAALQMLQSDLAGTALAEPGEYSTILLAGPAVELLDPDRLFSAAARKLKPRGRLVGIIPCLRDNSPENAEFIAIATSMLWPYRTAEELLESSREAGLEPLADLTRFSPVPRFIEAARNDQLGFHGFNQLIQRLLKQGYDPMEIGWGELRFSAVNHE